MKNIFVIKVIIICSIGLIMFNTSYAHTISHDNKVEFNYIDNTNQTVFDGIVNFEVVNYSVTHGQPWNGVSISALNELDVKSGRKGDDINNHIIESYNIPQEAYNNNANFAVIGTLSFITVVKQPPNLARLVIYSCPNIPFEQVNMGYLPRYVNNPDMWFMYPNEIGGYQEGTSLINPHPIKISCENAQTHELTYFTLSPSNENDHSFDISPE